MDERSDRKIYNIFLLKKSLRYKRTARPVSDIVNKQTSNEAGGRFKMTRSRNRLDSGRFL